MLLLKAFFLIKILFMARHGGLEPPSSVPETDLLSLKLMAQIKLVYFY